MCSQELALYGEFTIRETMLYFGWVAGMTTKQVDDKIEFLVSFLQLPPASRPVKNLRYKTTLCLAINIHFVSVNNEIVQVYMHFLQISN